MSDAGPETSKAAPPSPTAMLLEQPLYATIEVDEAWMRRLRHQGFTFDAHCVSCGMKTPFKVSASVFNGTLLQINERVMKDGVFSVGATCQRRSNHNYVFYFYLQGREIEKIGQIPSLEDLAGADIEKYRKQLKGGSFGELSRATGLASHGIGIGAFVYLRRIFERLIEEHRQQVEAADGAIVDWARLRMDERIQALSGVLPPALVKHKAAYGILSKGLHELSEDECKLYFPVVRAAIIQMLEEDWILRERRAKEKELERQLQDISERLKPAKGPAS